MLDFIEQLRRRLVELGCPIAQMRRLAQEVADHRDDLKQASLSEGLSEINAESRADAQLGDPLVLAKHLMEAARRSSWWGRHFIITFCLLPLLGFPVLYTLLLLLNLSLEFALSYGYDSEKLHAAAGSPIAFQHIVIGVHFADWVTIALITLLFCRLARWLVVNARWMGVSCATCSLYALLFGVNISPHDFTMGFSWMGGVSWTAQFIKASIPLLIGGAILVLQERRIRGFR